VTESTLTVEKTVAILLLSIDQEMAAQVMRCLSDDSVDKITRAMRELQELTVGRQTVLEVYTRSVEMMHKGGMALGDVDGLMRGVLKRAFGDERGDEVSRRAKSDILAKRPFAMFEQLTPGDLAGLLTEEHPQIAAVFIAHLDRKKAGEVLLCLGEDLRADIVHRVATLDRTPAEVVQRVLDVMRRKVKDLGLTALRSDPGAWIKAAASMLNNLGGGEKAVLEKIEAVNEQIAAAIREEMFTFDDLAKLDKKSMQKVLSSIDSRQLAVALKATTTAVEQAILGNLSKRAAAMVVEERDSLGPTALTEVLEAQQEILKTVRDMMDKGELKVGGAEQFV
jgi:flagellar motor switch protein FliG